MVGRSVLLNQVVGTYNSCDNITTTAAATTTTTANARTIKTTNTAVLNFGNGLRHSLSLGSVPAGLLHGQQVLLDLKLLEVKGEGVYVRVDSVRALKANPVAGSTSGLPLIPSEKIPAVQSRSGKVVKHSKSNKAPLSQPTEWKNTLSKPEYFLLISTTVEQLLGSSRVKLASLATGVLVSMVAPIRYDTDSELDSVSLDIFERCIRAESSLFVVSRKKIVSLQPAGPAFVERYLSLCPVIFVASQAIQSAIDANLPVSEAPPHAPGAYLRLQLWSLLRVKQKQWRAQFTFRTDRQKVFYTLINPPKGMVKKVQLSDIATRIRPIQIEIGTGGNDGRTLSLAYRFVPGTAAPPPPAHLAQLPRLAASQLTGLQPPNVPPTHNLPLPDLLSHRSQGSILYPIFSC